MSRFVKGNYIKRACEATGISRQTFYNWLRLAEEGKQPYLDMFDTFKKSRSTSIRSKDRRIQEAAKGGAVVSKKTITRKDGAVEVSESYAPPQWQTDAGHQSERNLTSGVKFMEPHRGIPRNS